MNIDELTDQEKSANLIKLMGWRKKWTDMHSMILLDSDGCGVGYHLMESGERMPDLYKSDNMPLLAKVIEWACQNMDEMDGMEPVIYFDTFFDPLNFHKSMKLFADAVLETAVEAGMVAREAK